MLLPVADYIPASRPIERGIPTPLTLTQLQLRAGGFIAFVTLLNGDLMVVNEASKDRIGIYNPTASSILGKPVFGDAVLCPPSEIA
jgi:hypothetical protein